MKRSTLVDDPGIFTGDDHSFGASGDGRLAAGGSLTVKIGPMLAHAGAGAASLLTGGMYPTVRDSFHVDPNVRQAGNPFRTARLTPNERTARMDIQVSFPGGKRVDAQADGFTIKTDQPIDAGGAGSAPEPFTLFLASIATCAGIYVVGFCQARGLSTDGISLVQRSEHDEKRRLRHVTLEVRLPADFPPQYRDAIARAAAACKVKKTLADPPTFDVVSTIAGERADAGAPAQTAV